MSIQRINNDPFDVSQTQNQNITDEKKNDASRAKINNSNESDPFDLELRIEPKRIQDIINNFTESKYCGSEDDCTNCGCNTCCSSC